MLGGRQGLPSARMRPVHDHHRVGRLAELATFTIAALIAAACVGRQNVAPSTAAPWVATGPTPAVSISPTPVSSGPVPKDVGCDAIIAKQTGPYPASTLAPPPQPTVAGGDAAASASAAIARATEAIGDLRSYQFTLDAWGRDLMTLTDSGFDIGVSGTVDQSTDLAIDGAIGTRMRESDNSAAISGGGPFKAGHGYVWETDNVSEVLEPNAAANAVAAAALVTPKGAAARFVVPFAAGYRRVGAERHGGIATEHYRASTTGVAAYAKTLRFKGKLTADLWIAKDAGYLAAARVAGTGKRVDPSTGETFEDSFTFAFEITHPDDPANVVTLPATPVPDPVRPTEAPVDLMLTYRVLPSNGREPTTEELNAIGVALRTRLDVTARPVKVDIVGLNNVVVTVCGTTTPEADRRLITSAGALTVVPLPKDRFGTATARGPTALPAVGSPIDPALPPIAPPTGLGLTRAHVDPTTGRRGLALLLGNKATETFRAYAANHRGEFVAVVLDGTVLATLPIDDRVASGHFVFTGDYTEAESRLLASYLYRDPILFELRPIEDVELPSRDQ
jgi:hypothetical protein